MARRDWLRDQLLAWGVPLLALIGFRSAIAAPFHVPSGSMAPTLEVGDRILVNKLSYGLNVPWLQLQGSPGLGTLTSVEIASWGDPQRGDVVVFRYPLDPSMTYVKRVVGLPGDELRIEGSRIWVNGEALSHEADGSYLFTNQACDTVPTRRLTEDLGGTDHAILQDPASPLRSRVGPLIVPEGQLFVMGDNRDHSADSRSWGLVPRASVRGKAIAVWMRSGCDGGLTLSWEALAH